jgi:hypothetical protein
MDSSNLVLTKDTVVDVRDDDQLSSAGEALYQLVGFSPDMCTVALLSCEGHVGQAAEHLTTGAWMGTTLVSWNWESLEVSRKCLAAQTGLPEQTCEAMLKNCLGNTALAERKLLGLPALP